MAENASFWTFSLKCIVAKTAHGLLVRYSYIVRSVVSWGTLITRMNNFNFLQAELRAEVFLKREKIEVLYCTTALEVFAGS